MRERIEHGAFLPWPAVLLIYVGVFTAGLALAKLAAAAEPDLCRPYASQFTDRLIKYMWNRAYHACLSRDEVPTLPADTLTALQAALLDTDPTLMHETPDDAKATIIDNLDKIGVVPATDSPKHKVKADPPADPVKLAVLPKADSAKTGTGRSGYARGSAQWNAYCKRYWPASWDQKTGTVIKTGHKRIPCPA
jgi:hypothetical protein